MTHPLVPPGFDPHASGPRDDATVPIQLQPDYPKPRPSPGPGDDAEQDQDRTAPTPSLRLGEAPPPVPAPATRVLPPEPSSASAEPVDFDAAVTAGHLHHVSGPLSWERSTGGRTPAWVQGGDGTPPARTLGPYVMGPLLGRGGGGEVYQAWDPALQRLVALKVLTRATLPDADPLLREARLQAMVDHPNVCKVYEVGWENGRCFVAMQFLKGATLRACAAELSLADKVAVLRNAAQGIQAAHDQGLLHRDVKPHNIQVEIRPGQSPRVHVMDFGLAVDEPLAEGRHRLQGTPAYMAPEQILGEQARIGPATDVYGLGACLFEALTHHAPHEGIDSVSKLDEAAHVEPPRPRELVPNLPRDLEAIVLKCLALEPQDRYATAAELAEDLQRFLDREPVLAHPPSLLYRLRRRIRKHAALAAAGAVAFLVLGTLGGWGLRQAWLARTRQRLSVRYLAPMQEAIGALRQAELFPLHDLRPERARLEARVDAVRKDAEARGPVAAGPGGEAVGLGVLALGRASEALEPLQRAYDLGLRDSGLVQALATALNEAYLQGLQEADQLADAEARGARRRLLERNFRDRALALLRQDPDAGTSKLIQGLGKLAEGRPAEALALARECRAASSLDLGAMALEGQCLLALGRSQLEEGRLGEALGSLEAATETFGWRVDIARSSPRARVDQARALALLARAKASLGQWDGVVVQRAFHEASMALTADPGEPSAHLALAELYALQARHALESREEGASFRARQSEEARSVLAVRPGDLQARALLDEAAGTR